MCIEQLDMVTKRIPYSSHRVRCSISYCQKQHTTSSGVNGKVSYLKNFVTFYLYVKQRGGLTPNTLLLYILCACPMMTFTGRNM
jgi:hypothetical protein